MTRTSNFTEGFSKLHGLGNDFVVLDRREMGLDIDEATAQWLCDRRRGVGADGVLVLLPSQSALAKMVIHNADGSVPEMCGNGLRCAVKFLVDAMAQRPARIDVETGAGVLACFPSYDEKGVAEVEIDMGPAKLVAPHLPSGPGQTPFIDRALPTMPNVKGTAVSMGNPHLVLWNAPLDKAGEWGPSLEFCPGFSQKTNVEFVQPQGEGIEVVVWERGVGLTLACGTGACASVAAGVQMGLLPSETWVPVNLPGGVLSIWVKRDLSWVKLRGPVTLVYKGVVSEVPPHVGT